MDMKLEEWDVIEDKEVETEKKEFELNQIKIDMLHQ